jgi:RecA/RadA recombinase
MSQSSLRLVEKDSMDKTKALDAALAQIERSFGKGSIMKLGKQDQALEMESISTGSLGLDIALGIGGLPCGRVVEIYGPESSGKTTLALHVIAESQKKGGVCAFVDAEHALDPAYAKKLGVNLDELLISQPDTGEQSLEITDTLVRSGAIDVLVVDSVAALVPRAELEGEMGDVHVGLQARLMSQALRKLTGSISRSRCMVIFINQIRMKIGVMFGNPETTSGSFTPASGWIFVALAPSRTGMRLSEIRLGSRSLKTRSRHRSRSWNSISCMARAFPRRASCWITALTPGLSINPAPGSLMGISASGKDVKTQSGSCWKIPKSPQRSKRRYAGMQDCCPMRCWKAALKRRTTKGWNQKLAPAIEPAANECKPAQDCELV